MASEKSQALRDELLAHIRAMVGYWTKLPDLDPITGDALTARDRCDGVAFSILSALDGCAGLPAFDLVARVYAEGDEEQTGPAEVVTISEMLHERYHRKGKRDGE